MGLLESLKEDEAALAEEMKADTGEASSQEGASEASEETPETQTETPNDGDDSGQDSEGNQEEAQAETPETPETQEKSSKQTKPDYHERRKARELAAELERTRAELNALRATPVQKTEAPKPEEKKDAPKASDEFTEPEPNRDTDYDLWQAWNLRRVEHKNNVVSKQLAQIEEWRREREEKEAQIAQQAEQRNLQVQAHQEFLAIEEEYKKTAPDYDDAVQSMFNRMLSARSDSNLFEDRKSIESSVKNDLFKFVLKSVASGLNPADELYKLATERYGYVNNKQTQKSSKPDLRVISNNQKRSASPLQGGSSASSMQMSEEAAANMTMAEFSKALAENPNAFKNVG